MDRVRALGLDEETTQQLFTIFDSTMGKFAALREDYRVHSGLRNAVALGILEIVSRGERNFLAIEHQAEFVGREYIRDRRL
jgi:hypothetical protein